MSKQSSAPTPYGAWPSPITAETITTGLVGFQDLIFHDDALYWLESRPGEGGRTVIVRHDKGASNDLLPAPFNARSRVHEYGGGAYTICQAGTFFVNFADQNIYRVASLGAAPEAVTQGDASERFADLRWDNGRRRLFAVRERHGAGEPINDLVVIDPESGAVKSIHGGHDFYAAPRLSPDGARLVFLVWDHPNMPWDGTQLFLATFDANGDLVEPTILAGGAAESIFQPEWLSADRLVYVSDESGYWNLYSYDASGIYNALPDAAEYGAPQWAFGTRTYVPLSERLVACVRRDHGSASLNVIDIDQSVLTPMDDRHAAYGGLTRTNEGVAFIAGQVDALAAIVQLNIADKTAQIVKPQGNLEFDRGVFSVPNSIQYQADDGTTAYAHFYEPTHPTAHAAEPERPPLLVLSHGGPTGSAGTSLDFRIQYYTSRGWAVLDVDYGGSTGYGRAYRERLRGQWGVVDVNDCVAAVRHVTAAGRADSNRVAIRGGSAGGYTTLAALAFTSTFRAGASHYGIGDLDALARDTHKFESRYIDGLVAAIDREARSPIHHLDGFDCPVIFFQGSEDRIVPPNQSQAMFESLRGKGVPVAYLLFDGEGHGFRVATNMRRAIEAEYVFFAHVFGFQPAEPLPPIDVENATWT